MLSVSSVGANDPSAKSKLIHAPMGILAGKGLGFLVGMKFVATPSVGSEESPRKRTLTRAAPGLVSKPKACEGSGGVERSLMQSCRDIVRLLDVRSPITVRQRFL